MPKAEKVKQPENVAHGRPLRGATKSVELPPRYVVPGEVFVVGSGDCGQLGLGPDVLEKARVCKLKDFDGKQVVLVRAGGLHNIALTADGKLWSWGCNDQKCLGRSGEETRPGPVEGLDNVRIVDVVCGDSMSVALSSTGEVYVWGTFRNATGIFGLVPKVEVQATPLKIPQLSRVVQIAAGANHCVAITDSGKVYTWGVGEQGQLGRRIMARHVSESSLIPRATNLSRAKCVQAFCGGYHTFFLNANRQDVYAVGLNNYGQLGIGFYGAGAQEEEENDANEPGKKKQQQEMTIEKPARVADLTDAQGNPLNIKQVAAGEHHSMVLTEDGRVYSFGRGDSYQLGLGNTENLPVPTLLQSLANKRVTSIDCGSCFSLAITEETPEGSNLYAWGYGEMGQLGNGETADGEGTDEETPFRLPLKNRKVLNAGAGGQHMVILLRPKEE